MKNVLLLMREAMPSLSASEKNIADYILKNPDEIGDLNIRSLAARTFASPSGIVRLCRRFGFSGYRDFKQTLLLELMTLGKSTSTEETLILKDDPVSAIIYKVTARNIRSLEDSRSLLDEETLQHCIDHLVSCDRILFYGIGSSYCVANDAYLKFLRLNKNCMLNEDWHSQLLTARNATPSDFAVVFSYSGQTSEMIECVRALKKNQTPCCAVTRYAPSPVSELVDYNLYISSTEPLFRNGAMSSRINQLNVIDILVSGYLNRSYEDSIRQLAMTHIRK